MATYAIGDVQGCFHALQRLTKKISYTPQKDTLWFCGDLINRGPHSLETLRWIKEQPNTRVVLGNHDLHLLALYHGNTTCYGKHTLDALLNASDIDALIAWLIAQPLAFFDEHHNILMVHAGFLPCWSLKETLSYSEEISHVLQDKNQRYDYFTHLYGNAPDQWDQTLKGTARWRFITNVFTRMRFCSAHNTLALDYKGAPKKAQKGIFPWYDALSTLSFDVVFGHWAALEGHCPHPHIHALDTGCVWGGALTAMRLEDKKCFQVSAEENT